MKRTLSMIVLLFITGVINSIGQSEKKDIPPPPPPKEPPKVDIKKFKPPIATEEVKSNNAFFKRNPTVANIWIDDNLTIIKLKSGKKEKYNLKNETEKKSFVERYGEPPIDPPRVVDIKVKYKPPPPPPPKPRNEQD